MSGKSECADAGKLSVQVVKPGTRVDDIVTKNYAVVLSTEDNFTFVAQGTARQLQDLGTQIGSMVRECSRGVSLGGDAGNGVGL
jgi:hypothetical protein